MKQNKFLQKTVTIDVKNLNSTCDAYQEVLGMIAMRDQLLFEVRCHLLTASCVLHLSVLSVRTRPIPRSCEARISRRRAVRRSS